MEKRICNIVDMTNPYELRNTSLKIIRKFFEAREIEEVITPLLVRSPALEPFLDSFDVHTKNGRFFLPTSPEFGLKKQFAFRETRGEGEGEGGIYEIAHSFRDDENSDLHAQEFIMLEWYQENLHYKQLAQVVTELIISLSEFFQLDVKKYEKIQILSVAELFQEAIEVELLADYNCNDYRALALDMKINLTEKPKDIFDEEIQKIEIFSLLFDQFIVPLLKKKKFIFVNKFPSFVRAMSTLEEGWSARIELFIDGIEIANGYQENYDKKELLAIWKVNNQIRSRLGKEEHPIDELLLELIPKMKGASGMALGIERLLMVLFQLKKISVFSPENHP